METFILIALCALNLLISWANCHAVGEVWQESKFIGGFMRVLAWCGAVQAAVGFSSVILLALVGLASVTHLLPGTYAHAAVSLWYLLVIIPALGTGLVITIHSLVQAWRERSIASVGTAAWNTFATGMNIYNAVEDVPSAFGELTKLFADSDDENGALLGLALAIVAAALAGGVLITRALVLRYAAQKPPKAVAVTA